LQIDNALDDAGRHAKEHVRKRSAFKRQKPANRSLKDNTRYRVGPTAGGRKVRLLWNKKYARFVEYGTRPHAIVARRASALRFFWRKGPAGPGTYFYRRVWHPGTRPYKFGWNASHSAYRVLGRRLDEMTRAARFRFRR
jgi:hypothetical protein